MKPTIHIGNSYCVTEDFTLVQQNVISEKLTYKNEEAFLEAQNLRFQLGRALKYKQFFRVKQIRARLEYLNNNLKVCLYNEGVFPTGLLENVKEALSAAGILNQVKIEDYRTAPKKTVFYDFKPGSPKLRYYQEEILQAAKKAHRGVFEASVGSGKSLCMQHIISHFGVPTLVIVPAKDLGIQLEEGFKKAFGAAKVEMVTTAKARAGKKLKPIRVVTAQSLTALKKTGELSGIIEGIQMVCLDEVHHAGADSYLSLLEDFDDVYYRFGFSGTFIRNDSKTLSMWSFLANVLYRYPATQAIADGYLTPIVVKIHPLEGIAGNTYMKEYEKNYCENPILFGKVRDLIRFEIPNDAQILILIGRKDTSGKILTGFLKEQGIDADYVDGDEKKEVVQKALKDFNSKKSRILIGSSILGEGIDIKSTEHLVLCYNSKSEINITQAIGRAIRLSEGKKLAYVHDFIFENTRYLENHAKIRMAFYKDNFNAIEE